MQDVVDVFESLFEHCFCLFPVREGGSLTSLNPASPPAFGDRCAISAALDFVRMQVAFEQGVLSPNRRNLSRAVLRLRTLFGAMQYLPSSFDYFGGRRIALHPTFGGHLF